MVGLVAMASTVTSAPLRSSRSRMASIAAHSFSFWSTGSWARTSRCVEAQAETRCSGLWPAGPEGVRLFV